MRAEIILEINNQVGNVAIDIAEMLLKRELKNDKEQAALVDKLVDRIKGEEVANTFMKTSLVMRESVAKR